MTQFGSLVGHGTTDAYARSRHGAKVTARHDIGIPPPNITHAFVIHFGEHYGARALDDLSDFPLACGEYHASDVGPGYGDAPLLGYLWGAPVGVGNAGYSSSIDQIEQWNSDVGRINDAAVILNARGFPPKVLLAHFDLAHPRSVSGNPLHNVYHPLRPVCGDRLAVPTFVEVENLPINVLVSGPDAFGNFVAHPDTVEAVVSQVTDFLNGFLGSVPPPPTPENERPLILLSVVWGQVDPLAIGQPVGQLVDLANPVMDRVGEIAREHPFFSFDDDATQVIIKFSFGDFRWARNVGDELS